MPADASSSSISLHWEGPEEDNGSPVTGYLLESASTSGRVAPVYQKAYSGKDARCEVRSTLPVPQDQARCTLGNVFGSTTASHSFCCGMNVSHPVLQLLQMILTSSNCLTSQLPECLQSLTKLL